MVGRLGIWMVGVAAVAVEEIDCSYVTVAAFAAAARLRWGRSARSCRYNRCHCNNVGLPSGDDLTRGRRWSSKNKHRYDKRWDNVVTVGDCRFAFRLDWVDTSESEESTSSRDKNISKEKTNIFEREKAFTIDFVMWHYLLWFISKFFLSNAACELLICPRNQGIRYSGKENQKNWLKLTSPYGLQLLNRFCKTPSSHPLTWMKSEIVIN